MSNEDSVNDKQDASKPKHKKVALGLSLLVLGMFGFGFALVPLYELVCQIGGINGVASGGGRVAESDLLAKSIDKSRLITVEFDATINANLPWEFRPVVKKIQVHPGEMKEVNFYAKNTAGRDIVGQAVPGVTPWQATEFFHKLECFCFTQQTLAAGEEKEMPLRFTLDPDLPAQYTTITLSYTLMDTNREQLKNKHSALQQEQQNNEHIITLVPTVHSGTAYPDAPAS